jgi:hypothetical protein
MRSNTQRALFVAASLYLSAGAATAQEVFICFTLHNDLANYDRRAHQVGDNFLRSFEAARTAPPDAERSTDQKILYNRY